MVDRSSAGVYDLLIEKAGKGMWGQITGWDIQTKTVKRMMQISYTPAEAEAALALPGPGILDDPRIWGGPKPPPLEFDGDEATVEWVAEKIGRTVAQTQEILNRLRGKRLIGQTQQGGKTRYFGGGGPASGWRFMAPSKYFTEAQLRELIRLEHKRDLDEGAWEGYNAWQTPLTMVLVAEKGVLNKEELEPWEKGSEIIKQSVKRAIFNCPCRMKFAVEQHGDQKYCDKPLYHCLVFDAHLEPYDVPLSEGLELHSAEECIENLEAGLKAGLVSVAPTADDPANNVWICQCCPDCCHILAGIGRLNLPRTAGPIASNFEPQIVDQSKCNFCKNCVDKCPMKAAWYHGARMLDKSDEEIRFKLNQCIGCGICAISCARDALKMVKVRNWRPAPPEDPGRFKRMSGY